MATYPAFQFYASDWLGSNRRAMMTLEEQGAYINLLCRQWADPTCSLPDDDEMLARLSELGEKWSKCTSVLLRSCFPKHADLDGRIAHPKLLKLREEYDKKRANSRKGGIKSGKTRRAKSKQKRSSVNNNETKCTSVLLRSEPRSECEVNANTPNSELRTPVSELQTATPDSKKEGFPDGKPRRAKPDRSEEIVAVFDHYRTLHPKSVKSPKSSSKEWKLIKDRLEEGYSVSDLCGAIDGIHKIPFNTGVNDSGKQYLDLQLIFRSASNVTKYMEANHKTDTLRHLA